MKTMLKTAVTLCALMWASNVCAEDHTPDGKVIRKIKWSEVPLPKGTSLSKDGTAVIAEHPEAKPVSFALLSLENPGIHTKAYALRCSLRCTDVAGAGYLEMWNVFPGDDAAGPELRAFSRTMGEAGPMAKVTGTSEWRPAVLPFNADGAKGDLKKLEVNLFLPGKGRVEIRDVELVEFGDPRAMWDSIRRTAEAMLAPPAQPAVSVAEPAKSAREWTTSRIVLVSLIPAAAVTAWFAVKKRRDVEQRRMRALDTM